MRRATAAAALLAAAGLSTASSAAERSLTPHYTITIPAPSAQRVGIRCELAGVEARQLELTFMNRAGPGLPPGFEAYRIRPVVRRSAPGSSGTTSVPIPYRITTPEHGNAVVLHLGDPAARGSLGDVTIEYDLDLANALPRSTKPSELARLYQDRMIVTDTYATLRGDTLFVPVGHAIERPRVTVVAPPGWTPALDADREGEELVIRGTFSAAEATRSTRWFGLVGAGLTQELRKQGSMEWALVMAPTPLGVRTVSATIWDRVRHYNATFGIEPLAYLAQPPPLGAGRQAIHLFAIPFPPEVEHARGGQYLPGTAYLFYSTHCPDELGHVMAHEYLHAYNCRAMLHGEGAHSESGQDSWFREGYTDVQATLANLGLSIADDRKRLLALKSELATAWALSMDRDPDEVIRTAGLPDPDGEHARAFVPRGAKRKGDKRPPRSLTAMVAGELWKDTVVYDRAIQGRSRLIVFGLAILLERARPGRRGLDAWLRILLSENGLTGASPAALDAAAIKHACLEAPGRQVPALEEFYQRYVESGAAVSFDELRRWLDDDGLRTLCPRISSWGASPAPLPEPGR